MGIVEKVSGTSITVIEGNYSDSVKRRTISVNGRYIRGYGVPKYGGKEATGGGTAADAGTGQGRRVQDGRHRDIHRREALHQRKQHRGQTVQAGQGQGDAGVPAACEQASVSPWSP